MVAGAGAGELQLIFPERGHRQLLTEHRRSSNATPSRLQAVPKTKQIGYYGDAYARVHPAEVRHIAGCQLMLTTISSARDLHRTQSVAFAGCCCVALGRSRCDRSPVCVSRLTDAAVASFGMPEK